MPKTLWILCFVTLAALAGAARAADPEAARLYVQASQQYIHHDYDQALQSLTQSLKSDPRQAAAYQLMGYCYQAKGDASSALRYYRYSLQLNPNNPVLAAAADRLESSSKDPLVHGHELYKAKRYSDALEAYTRASNQQPSNAKAWQSIGNCQYAMGDRVSAMASYRRSLQMDPNNTSLAAFMYRLSLSNSAVAAGSAPVDWVQPVWRSALLPGWGQAYNGESGKGVLLGTVTLGLLAGEVATYMIGSQARSDYLNASGASADYDTPYNTWDSMAKANHVFYIGMTAMYAYTLIDAYLNAKPSKTLALLPGDVNVAFSPDGVQAKWTLAQF